MKNNISIKRIVFLFKRTFHTQLRTLGIALLAYTGVLALVMTANALDKKNYDWGAIEMSCNSFMIIFGFIFTSGIFKEMHKPTTGISYLMLPATSFEKFLVKWLITSPIFIITFSILSYSTIYIGNMISQPAFNFTFKVPLMSDMIDLIVTYMAIQALYFFGASFFKKSALIKTTLCIVITAITLGFISAIFGHFWVSNLPQRIHISFDFRFVKSHYFDMIVWIVTPILFIIASYFSVKEKEV